MGSTLLARVKDRMLTLEEEVASVVVVAVADIVGCAVVTDDDAEEEEGPEDVAVDWEDEELAVAFF